MVYLGEGESELLVLLLGQDSRELRWRGAPGLASPSALRPGWLWMVAAEEAATDQWGGDTLGTRVVHVHVQRE